MQLVVAFFFVAAGLRVAFFDDAFAIVLVFVGEEAAECGRYEEMWTTVKGKGTMIVRRSLKKMLCTFSSFFHRRRRPPGPGGL